MVPGSNFPGVPPLPSVPVARVPMTPLLSIVIPALNESASLPALLRDLHRVEAPHEVIVVDGGSTDDTAAVAERHAARVVRSPPGRGVQLAAGAAIARGATLCFLHADVRLPPATRTALAALAAMPDGVAIAFRLRIARRGWRYRFVEWGTDRRSRWARMPYGDQGLVLTRLTYEAAGGFPPLPIMEDVVLVSHLRRIAEVRVVPERVHVSARRFQRDGVLRRMLRNWMLMLSYLAGTSPARLAASYTPHDDGGRDRQPSRWGSNR